MTLGMQIYDLVFNFSLHLRSQKQQKEEPFLQYVQLFDFQHFIILNI